MTAPNATMSAELVAYRLHTGSDRSKWQWMDGTPSVGAMREAELHGWEIEYAYGSAAVAAMAEREAALCSELNSARSDAAERVQFAGKFNEAMANEMRAAGCVVEGYKVRNVRAENAEAERDALAKEVEALRRFALDVKDACAPDGVVNQPAIYEMACDITARAEARDG